MRFAPKSFFNSRPSLQGAVLFEVVVALVLFVSAATIITGALNASLNSVERLRRNTHAANLAVSVLSELQMGIKTLALTGPQPFEEPFAGWTWEVVANPIDGDTSDSSPLRVVEVIIRHDESELVYRLNQTLRLEETAPASDAMMPPDSPSF